MLSWIQAFAVGAAVELRNMNGGGDYLIQNPNHASKTAFNTDYATKNAEFFDVS
jgi:hypothetical protein